MKIEIRKKILMTLFLLIIICFNNVTYAEEIQTNSYSEYKNIPLYQQRIEKNLKIRLATDPKNYYILKELGDIYCDREDLHKAKFYYIQALRINKNEKDLNKLGLICYLQDDYEDAIKCYKMALAMNPENTKTKNKIEIIQSQISQNQDLYRILALEPKFQAPKELHSLVTIDGKLKNPDDEKKLHKIIDFIWSDREGRYLLQNAFNAKITFCIKKNITYSQFIYPTESSIENSIVYHENNSSSTVLPNSVNKYIEVKEKDISDFQETDTTLFQNEYAIAMIIHELCHVLHFTKFSKCQNSQEEELISTIIGFNIASRLLTNRTLTRNEVIEIGSTQYNLTIKPAFGTYHWLPENEGFAKTLHAIGFELPFYDVYYNLSNLEYKVNKNNLALKNYIKTININSSIDYESIYKNKFEYNYYYMNIVPNGLVSIYYTPYSKFSRKLDKETVFNLNIAAYNVAFPEGYNDVLIPLELYRREKHIKIKYHK